MLPVLVIGLATRQRRPRISTHQQLCTNMGHNIGTHSPGLDTHTTVDNTIPWDNITNLA